MLEIGHVKEEKIDHTKDHIVVIFTELMYGLDEDNPPSKENFIAYLKEQKDYESVYRKWVESPDFPTLFFRAKESFI